MGYNIIYNDDCTVETLQDIVKKTAEKYPDMEEKIYYVANVFFYVNKIEMADQ